MKSRSRVDVVARVNPICPAELRAAVKPLVRRDPIETVRSDRALPIDDDATLMAVYPRRVHPGRRLTAPERARQRPADPAAQVVIARWQRRATNGHATSAAPMLEASRHRRPTFLRRQPRRGYPRRFGLGAPRSVPAPSSHRLQFDGIDIFIGAVPVFKSSIFERFYSAKSASVRRSGSSHSSSIASGHGRRDVPHDLRPNRPRHRDPWDRVRDQLDDQFPKIGPLMDDAEADVLAFRALPRTHWSNRVNQPTRVPQQGREATLRRRGHLPNEASVVRLVGAVLADVHDEWQAAVATAPKARWRCSTARAKLSTSLNSHPATNTGITTKTTTRWDADRSRAYGVLVDHQCWTIIDARLGGHTDDGTGWSEADLHRAGPADRRGCQGSCAWPPVDEGHGLQIEGAVAGPGPYGLACVCPIHNDRRRRVGGEGVEVRSAYRGPDRLGRGSAERSRQFRGHEWLAAVPQAGFVAVLRRQQRTRAAHLDLLVSGS